MHHERIIKVTKEVFEQKSWKDSFTKDTRPVFTDLEAFIDNEVYRLFRSFAECILQEYDLRFGIPVWNAEKGWTYRIGKAGVYLITGIQIKKDRFIVEDIEVGNLEQYNRLLTYIKELYENNKSGFLKRIEEKNLQQRARSAEKKIWSEWRRTVFVVMGAEKNLLAWAISDSANAVFNILIKNIAEVIVGTICLPEPRQRYFWSLYVAGKRQKHIRKK